MGATLLKILSEAIEREERLGVKSVRGTRYRRYERQEISATHFEGVDTSRCAGTIACLFQLSYFLGHLRIVGVC